jgi:hypothetical protein
MLISHQYTLVTIILNFFKDVMKHLNGRKVHNEQLKPMLNDNRGVSHSRIQYFDMPSQVQEETGFLTM